MLSGVKATTVSGHWTAISYGPPLAHDPPTAMTAKVDRKRSVKHSEKRNQDAAEPTTRVSAALRQLANGADGAEE